MISSEDVRHVTFDKAFQGYRREDVDDYLKQVAQAMDDLAAQNDDLQKKLVMLAQRIEKYRTMENSLSTSMINAQRLGENVIREAKQKAAEIIRAANMKADDREQRARDDVELAKQEIVTLKSEADSFKRSLMEMYRKHINLISKMPEYNPPAQEEAQQPAPQPAAAPQTTQSAPAAEPAAAEPEQKPLTAAEIQPVNNWADILAAYQAVNPAVSGSLAESSAYVAGNNLLIVAKNRFFLTLLKNKENALSLRETVKQFLGAEYNIRAKCSEPEEQISKAQNLLQKAMDSHLDTAVEE